MVLSINTIDHVWIMLTGLGMMGAFLGTVLCALWLCEDDRIYPASRFKTVMRYLIGVPILIGVLGGLVWVIGAATLGYIQ